MIHRIVTFSVKNKLITGALLLVFTAWGIYSTTQLSIDALPDVTNNQVLVNTFSPNLATQEVEQFITYPLELAFKNIPDVAELRSISRSGLSIITIVFKDNVPVYLARQLVSEKIKLAESNIPSGYGTPEISPPTTGLGEIYQYTLTLRSGFENKFTAMDLRTVQDWIVKRQLLGVPGVVDVSSFGGYLKQYEVAVDPKKLLSMNISLIEVFDALQNNNENTGGSYIDKGPNIYFIRGEGLLQSLDDIRSVVVKNVNGMPVHIRDLATVNFGYAPRYGALTRNGKGETVGGVVLMMKGANSVQVIKAVKERMSQVEKSLPEGVAIDVFVDRTKLINNTIHTVEDNLLKGALIVILVLVLLLGNWRAGMIVASVIPLSMLFAISMMNVFGVSANLMSMGALDFGLIVDGAVIIVEGMMYVLHQKFRNTQITQHQMDYHIIKSTSGIMNSAVFGQIIILIVYVPIFALIGIEGKMFRPMAQTVSFAIIGALLLSLTYVPLMSSLFLSKRITAKESWSDKFIRRLQIIYAPFLQKMLQYRKSVLLVSLLLLTGAFLVFQQLGGEFIPELDEGDFATNVTIRQGSNLQQSVSVSTQLESILLKNFPEVNEVVSKIGTSEVPTDPMPVESGDLIIVMKDKKEWTSTRDHESMVEMMNEKMSVIPGMNLSFEQPIQMRFNELIAGVKSDIAIKIFGENLDLLYKKGNEVAAIIGKVQGTSDIKVEQIVGMPQLVVKYNRDRIAQYGLNIAMVNRILNTALAGGTAGVIYEGEKRFDLVVRLADYRDADEEKVNNIYVPLPDGSQIPLGQLATVSFQSAPAEISRDNGERRIVVETNVRGRDIQSTAMDIQKQLSDQLKLPAGYYLDYSGTFKNLQEAKGRLMIAIPAALFLIFFLLFITFRSLTDALIIFSAIPLAAIGGVAALWLCNMNFSISAGIGFIALFGVAVLNGIVLISYFNRLKQEGEMDITIRILKGTAARLRPVLATAAVASLGFLPMALSNSTGSEVQKPLATVVIGGLISSTLLTLVVLPVLYSLFHKEGKRMFQPKNLTLGLMMLLTLLFPSKLSAQQLTTASSLLPEKSITLQQAIELALQQQPSIKGAQLVVQQQEVLRKTNFTLDPLNITYQGGQINSKVNDYNVSAATGIQFPTVYARQSQLQNQNIQFSQQQLNVAVSEVKKQVAAVYYQVLYGKEKVRLLLRLDSVYRNFSVYADKKYTVGESNQLEKISAQAQLKQIQIQLQQAQSDVVAFQTLLQQWTGSTEMLVPSETSLEALPPPLLTDTFQLALNPLLQVQQQQLNVRVAQWKLEKSKWAPALQVGAFNQSLDKAAPFWGYSIGTSIPIFKTGQSGRTQAAQLQSEIAMNDVAQMKWSLNTAYVKALQEYEKYSANLQYYQNEGLNLSDRIYAVADKSYREGAIDYVEYIQSLRQVYQMQSEYLQTLNDYNQSVIDINYLLNH
ncbi:MAG: CusA/CzcA family heavy metal efflux RND transporter [Chitinophagaceae bacterium]|nr:CusA/CzcA family heavy metal efflux RND transporter [Chitinophagaceae bacterium]